MMNRLNTSLLILVTVVTTCVWLGAPTCHAQFWSWTFDLDGQQVVPPSGSPGTGQAYVAYDSISRVLFWEISYSDLEGTVTSAHFHGPAQRGQNAGVQIDIGAISGLKSPMIGQTEISYEQSLDLVEGLWYVNIHTDEYPSGEIRGQVESCMTLTVDKLRALDVTTFTIEGGEPGRKVALVYGFEPGSSVIRDVAGFCATLNIAGVTPRRVIGTATLNPVAVIRKRLPRGSSGLPVLFQAAMQTCPDECTSNMFGSFVE